MSTFAENLDRYLKSSPPDFLLRAFFPWVFVILLNVAIYEIWIPDGGSLTEWLTKLNEHVQLYTAIAIVLSIAAIAAVSDGLVELAISPFRRASIRDLATATMTGAPLPAKAGPLSPRNEQERPSGGNRLAEGGLELMLSKIAIAEIGIHRSGNLVVGMGVSIWLNALELVQYQRSLSIRLAIVCSLAAVMAIQWRPLPGN